MSVLLTTSVQYRLNYRLRDLGLGDLPPGLLDLRLRRLPLPLGDLARRSVVPVVPAAAGAVLPVDGAGRANAVVKIRNFAAFITSMENMYH